VPFEAWTRSWRNYLSFSFLLHSSTKGVISSLEGLGISSMERIEGFGRVLMRSVSVKLGEEVQRLPIFCFQ